MVKESKYTYTNRNKNTKTRTRKEITRDLQNNQKTTHKMTVVLIKNCFKFSNQKTCNQWLNG